MNEKEQKKKVISISILCKQKMARAADDLLQFTQALRKAKTNDPNDITILDILNNISSIPITIDLLKKTKAGKAVSQLRKATTNVQIKTLASAVLIKMKQAASSQGYNCTKKKPSTPSFTSARSSSSSFPTTTSTSTATFKFSVTGSSISRTSQNASSQPPRPVSNNNIPGLRSTGNASRNHVQRKMYEILKLVASNEKESWPSSEDLGGVAVTVEDAINSQSNAITAPKEYMIIVKRLMYNLRANDPLRAAVARALLPPYVLVVMEPKEMANDTQKLMMADAREYDKGNRRSNWKQAHAMEMAIEAGVKNPGVSMYTCPRCRSRRVHSFAMVSVLNWLLFMMIFFFFDFLVVS